MRIDPKTYTLDANERPVILAALRGYIQKSERTLKTQKRNRYTREIDIARAQDLVEIFSP